MKSCQLKAVSPGFGIPVEFGEANGFWRQESGLPHGILHLGQAGSTEPQSRCGPSDHSAWMSFLTTQAGRSEDVGAGSARALMLGAGFHLLKEEPEKAGPFSACRGPWRLGGSRTQARTFTHRF